MTIILKEPRDAGQIGIINQPKEAWPRGGVC